MKIAVTGSTGLVGSALVAHLEAGFHQVVRVVRRTPKNDSEIQWDPMSGFPSGTAALEGCDAVVHLAGENIAAGRWTAARKKTLRDSRVIGTRTLCETLTKLERKPEVLICGSALGYYGETGDQFVDESAPPGCGFLPELCVEWEAQAAPAQAAGIRVVFARTGIVLSAKGGALAKMLPIFKLGLGAPLGSGKQYISWIGLDDEVRAIIHCIKVRSLTGPVNLAAPNPVTNREFTKTLAGLLNRPVMPAVPTFVMRLLYGEVADAGLLCSTRLKPRRLLETGFEFEQPELGSALGTALREG